MIKTEMLAPDALKITAPQKLAADDFPRLAPQVDKLIQQHGKIRLLIDASHLSGWESVAAFENHLSFVKGHQQYAERIAVIVAHEWQKLLVAAVRMFIHPDAKAYDIGQEDEARRWILE